MNEAEFWASAERHDNGCLVWTRTCTSAGYGNVRFDGKMRTAHSVAYTLVRGEIPEGKQLDHICRNRKCIEPSHLEPVTRRENILRGLSPQAKNARKTHCPSGHEYTPENIYRVPSTGHRQCLTCIRERGKVTV